MTKANKVGEGVYRTDDGQWQILKYEEEWHIEHKVKNRWTEAGSAKTLAAAEKELTSLTKTADSEEAPEEKVGSVNQNATDEGIVPVETEKE